MIIVIADEYSQTTPSCVLLVISLMTQLGLCPVENICVTSLVIYRGIVVFIVRTSLAVDRCMFRPR